MAAPPHPAFPPATSVDPKLEVRLAVVLYGGVSLAIYINGVAQELLSLSRATAPRRRPAPGAVPPLIADGDLRGAEQVYRELGRRLHLREDEGAGEAGSRWSRPLTEADAIGTSFVVDVLSGTSAGGINGVFLAKALANQQTLDDLRNLWISEGDIDLLLHDRSSNRAMPEGYRLPAEPTSLLNSQRMFRKLHEALNGLDDSNREGEGEPSPFVDELDLFVTSTDLDGVVLPIQLADRRIFERRHRNVFHFLYAKQETTGDPRNDFIARNNRFLAFAARCTSSFPFAFEPMQLGDIRVFDRGASEAEFAEDLGRWSVFFRDYLKASDLAGRIPDAASSDFPRRSFGDGGYLDNKPFGHAIDALRWRRSTGRVMRKLLYVEPSPEHPERDAGAHVRPDAIENLMAAAMTIPRSETIREDVMRVRERNVLIQRINRATRTIESDVLKGFSGREVPHWDSTSAWMAEGLQEMSAAYGPGFGSYHRLKVAEVTSDLAELVTRVAGLDEDSQEFVAIRYLVSAWRQKYYTPEKPKPGDTRKTENSLLVDFDLAYRLRRIAFVDSRIDALLAFDGYAYEALKAEYEGKVEVIDRAWRDPAWREALERELRRIKRELGDQYVMLRRRGRQLRSRGNGSELREAIVRLKFTHDEFAAIVTPREPRERIDRAKAILGEGGRFAELQAVSQQLAEALRHDFVEASAQCTALLKPQAPSPPPSDVPAFARAHLWPLYDKFDAYDMVLFPIRSGTDYGEGVEVATIRISPEDASRLVPELAPDGRRVVTKLAGTRLGNFGGFLAERWRRSDMMWGRLDAAERLIHSLVPESEAVAAEYVARAQAGIVCDTLAGMGVEQGQRMLIECAIRTENGKPRPQLISDLVERLRSRIPAEDTHALQVVSAPALLDLYDRAFRERTTGLEREAIVRLASRSIEITGRMFEAMSTRSARLGRRVPYLMRSAGRMLWTLVEIAAPRSLGRLVTTYWLGVIYLTELVMWVAGGMLKAPEVASFGGKLFAFTLAIDLARRITGFWLAKSRLLRVIALILIALLAYLVVTGWDHAAREVWPVALRWLGDAWSRLSSAVGGIGR